MLELQSGVDHGMAERITTHTAMSIEQEWQRRSIMGSAYGTH